MIPHLLLFLWQEIAKADSPINDRIEFGIWITLATLAGGFLTKLLDYLGGRASAKIAKRKVDSEIDVSISTISKNENETIINLQRLLMEMQEKIDHWIGRFEGTVDEAQRVEADLQKTRRILYDVLNGRKSYYDAVAAVIELLNRIEPFFVGVADKEAREILNALQGDRYRLQRLQTGYEADMQGDNPPPAKLTE